MKASDNPPPRPSLPRAYPRATQACALAVVGLSLWVLAAWSSGQGASTGLGPSYVPMAPLTAWLLLLLGLGLGGLAGWPQSAAARGLALLAGLIAVLLGLLVAAQPLLGFRLAVEAWLAPDPGSLGGIPLGRTSVLTALGFLAGGLSLLLLSRAQGRRCRRASWLLGFGLLLWCLLVLLSYALGAPLLYGGRNVPMALPSALALALLALGLLAAAGPGSWALPSSREAAPGPSPASSSLKASLAGLLLLSAAIGATGYFYLEHQLAEARRTALADLAAVIDLKAGQIAAWLRERRGDALVALDNPMVQERARRLLAGESDPRLAEDLRPWLQGLQRHYAYLQVALFDAQGRPRLGAPWPLPLTDHQGLDEALGGQGVVFTDLHRQALPGREQQGKITLGLWVPVGAGPGTRALGALQLLIDPEEFLYPLLRAWPTPSPSAELVLARREGDQAVVLNNLRHRKNAPLDFRLPLEPQGRQPMVMAVQGRPIPPQGTLDGRGVPVLAASRPVPGTSWHLVAKVDQEEILAHLRQMAWTTGLVMISLLLAGAAGLWLFWWRRDNRWLLRQLAMDAERQELAQRVMALYSQANEIILLMDQDGHILEGNQRAVEAYGYPLEQLLRMNILDLRAPQAQANYAEDFRRADNPQGIIFETLHQRRDGSVFPVEVSSRPVELGGDKYRQSFIRDISQRKAAEQALAQSEAELSALFQGAPIMMILVDHDRRVVKANRAALETAGRPDQEASGLRGGELMRCMHSLDDPQGCGFGPACQGCLLRAALLRTLETGQESFRQEVTLLLERPQGPEEVFALVSTTRLHTQAKPLVLLCLEDITERKRAELALKQSKERFRLLFEEAPLAYQSLDEEGRILEVNQAWLQALGYRREQVIGKWFGSLLREEYVPHFRQNFPRFREAGHIEGVEFDMLRADGSTMLVSFNGAIGRDALGRFQQTHCIFLDITEHRRAEQAIHESEERFRGTFEQAAVGMVHTGLDGSFLRVNQRFCDFLGYGSQELLGKKFAEVTHPEDLSTDLAQLSRLMSGEIEVHSRQKRYLRQDGSIVWGKLTVSAVKDTQGRPQYLIAVVEDITEQRKLEAQLRQAQKMEAMGTLAGGIAHDFNNILGAVLGYAEMALDDSRQDGVDPHDLEQVIQAALRAKNLVQQILTFGRKSEAELRPLDLNQAVEQARDILERTLPKMIAIDTRLAPDLDLVNGDPNQVEQVLLNLGTNARDAMPEGGRLLIETQNVTLGQDYCARNPEMLPGRYVLLMFSDTGQGMDLATREKVFDPFFTTKEVGKGTGLGLSMVYGIVKGHRGHIFCYSEPGLGTIFKIYLPSHQAEPQAATAQEAPDEEMLRGCEVILLVDDEEPLRQLGSRLLEGMGYQVRTAQSGEEALEVFKQMRPRPDLVVMDLGMPGMGGKKCLERLLALEPDQKVVIASGYSVTGQVQEALRAGGRAYVSKPFRRLELLGRVREVLDQTGE